jgi:hypothetical protein
MMTMMRMRIRKRVVDLFALALGLTMTTILPSIAHAQDLPPQDPPTTPTQPPPQQQPAVVVGPPQTPDAPTIPKKKKPTVVGMRFDGGYALRRLVGLPLTGADLGFAIGAQPASWAAIWGATRVFVGSSENGLSVYTWRLGPDFDLIPFDRLRISPGGNFFVVGISRAIRDDTITSFGFAAHIGLRVDIIQSDSFALFGRADIDAGYEFYNGSVYWGPTFGAGVDFDIHGDRSKLKEETKDARLRLRRDRRRMF